MSSPTLRKYGSYEHPSCFYKRGNPRIKLSSPDPKQVRIEELISELAALSDEPDFALIRAQLHKAMTVRVRKEDLVITIDRRAAAREVDQLDSDINAVVERIKEMRKR